MNRKKPSGSDEMLAQLRAQLRRGDLTKIAKQSGFSHRYVTMVLNPETDNYQEDIVRTAMEVVRENKARRTSVRNDMRKILSE